MASSHSHCLSVPPLCPCLPVDKSQKLLNESAIKGERREGKEREGRERPGLPNWIGSPQVPNGFRVTKRARDNKWAKLMRFAYEIRVPQTPNQIYVYHICIYL